MKMFISTVAIVLGVGTANAQTLPSLSDLPIVGPAMVAAGSQLGAVTRGLQPPSLPLGVPVACLGNCTATVATVCQTIGYHGSKSVALNTPIIPNALATGECLLAPQ